MSTRFDLPDSSKKLFLTTLLYLAQADQKIHVTESQFIRKAITEFGMTLDECESVLQQLKAQPDVPSLTKEIKDPKASRYLLQQLMLLAHADDHYSEPERQAILSIAHSMKLPGEWVRELEKWASEGQAWKQKGQDLVAADL